MRVQTVLLFFIISCLFSCENKDEHFPIHLEAYFEDDNVILNWSMIDIEDFEFYRIKQSSDGNNFYPINTLDTTSSDIYDIATTSFVLKNYPDSETTYFKVIAFGSKTYKSNEVLVDIPRPKEFNFHVSDYFLMADENKILFLEQKTAYATLYLYDYAYDEIVNSADIYLNNSLSPYCFGKYNGNYEFYYFSVEPHITSTRKLHALDVLTLELDTAANMASNNEIATNSNGVLYIESFNGIGMLSRKDFVYSLFPSTNIGSVKKLTYNSKSNKLIADLYRNYIGVFDLDNDGSVTSFNKTYLTGDSWSSSFYINNTSLCYQTYADMDSPGVYSKIIDINTLNQYYLLDAFGDTLSCNTFYSNGDFLYASDSYTRNLYCYDINELNYIKTLNCRLDPDIFIIHEENLFVIERGQNYKTSRFEIRKLD